MLKQIKLWSQLSLVGMMLAVGTLAPALADTPNFGRLTLSPGFRRSTGTTTGQTGGAFSLPAIANRDYQNNRCLGYGAPTPDFILELQQDFPKLSLQVNSGGNDTTLMVQGPNDQTVRCADDSGTSADASLVDTNWKAGTYRVWVGSARPNTRHSYTLSVRE